MTGLFGVLGALPSAVAVAALTFWLATRGVPPAERERVMRLAIISVLIRWLLSTVFETVPGSRLFHEDADGYERNGMWRARSVSEGFGFQIPHDTNYGFFYYGGAVYYLFGQFRPLLPYFNGIVGTIVMIRLYVLTRRFFQPSVAWRAALYAGLFPSMILWSAVASKDINMVLLCLIAVEAAQQLHLALRLRPVLLLALVLWLTYTIRFYIPNVILAAVVLSKLLATRRPEQQWIRYLLVVAAVGICAAAGVFSSITSPVEETLGEISYRREALATTAASGFEVGTDVSTPGKALAFLPLGLCYLVFSPFPWNFTSLRSALTLPEMVFWWTMCPLWVRGGWYVYRNHRYVFAPVLAFTAVLLCTYALFHGNIGVAFRQRNQVFPFFFVFAAIGWAVRECDRRDLPRRAILAIRAPAAARPAVARGAAAPR